MVALGRGGGSYERGTPVVCVGVGAFAIPQICLSTNNQRATTKQRSVIKPWNFYHHWDGVPGEGGWGFTVLLRTGSRGFSSGVTHMAALKTACADWPSQVVSAGRERTAHTGPKRADIP